jgi:hypothetical protein
MPKPKLSPEYLDKKTPPDVIITDKAPEPFWDPSNGIAVARPEGPAPVHRLVTIGDSLTQGFQSAAIFNTDLSYPAIIAYELGWLDLFRRPSYPGYGGLPINIEYLVHTLEAAYGDKLNWWELAPAVFTLRHTMDEIEDYWERGSGSNVPKRKGINQNLAIYGWDLRDTLVRNARACRSDLTEPKDDLVWQIVENANERAALRVLPGNTPAEELLTPLQAAKALGDDGGIETLIVFIGANNALGAITSLKVMWSDTGYDDPKKKRAFTVWRPTHFKRELDLVVAEVQRITARHVIWASVPHVTIAPLARGVDRKMRIGSRYYPYYTRVWISDDDFDAKDDPCITGAEARAVDSAIDQYNRAIADAVWTARRAGRDWYLLDVAGLLDRLAARRYIADPAARPDWWRPYDLPPELDALRPKLNSRFFAAGPEGRTDGGLFSLDGVHPTTIAYGILAQEFINIMQRAGVTFYAGDGTTPRQSPVKVDFARLVARDTLIADPPPSISSDLHLIGWLDEKIDFARRLFRLGA